MKINHLNLLYFSPTGTTQKVLEGIAAGFQVETVEHINLTLPDITPKEQAGFKDGLTIIGAPVYSGRIPPDAARRIAQFKAAGSPSVLVVLYGNREFEDALKELKDLALENGYQPIAGGAFIGEHSFADKNFPIGHHRPDDQDMEKCKNFGDLIQQKIHRADSIDNIPVPEFPGNHPYREPGVIKGVSPVTIDSICTRCGTCVSVCPKSAITLENDVVTDPDICILCCACVKGCPSEARIMDNPKIRAITQWLWENCSNRKEPEFFL